MEILSSQKQTGFTFLPSIRSKLIFMFIILSLIPMASLGILAYFQSQAALRERATEEIDRLTKIEASTIDKWLINRTQDLGVIAGAARIKSMKPDQAKAAIDLYYKQWGIYETIFVVGLDGKSIASSDNKLYALANEIYIQKALNGETYISQAAISKVSGNVIIAVTTPVIVENKVVGVAGAYIPMKTIHDLLVGALLGKTGDAYLIDQQGYFITPSRNESILKKSGKIKESAELEVKVNSYASQNVLAGKDGMFEYLDYRGVPVLGSFHWIAGQKWGLIIEQDSSEAFSAINSLGMILIIVSLIITFLIGVIAFFVAGGISSPIAAITKVAKNIAQGNISQNISYHSNDEIGDLANSFRGIVAYQQEIAKSADCLANCDFSGSIQPKSEEDVLGKSFLRMITQLRAVILQVSENAKGVNVASKDLASASMEAGQATSQIATTIQQLAKGTNQQAESTSHSASSIEQLSRTIGTVADGAQSQAEAISKMAGYTEPLSISLQQVSGNTISVSQESDKAKIAAKEGKSIVNNTIKRMDMIRIKVDLSALKVEEMGRRSDQIGVILETIDDIASQTNLLALNAAIEAARAGEPGSGFAVVADEVRKLAERSSISTREIADLIKDIRKTVFEAISAMNASTSEVKAGSEYTSEAGIALQKILEAVEAVREQASQATISVNQMEVVSEQLVSAADEVSAIVEENTAATEEMAAGTTEITRAIENIASVSEENSAAVEEVSASVEEMSAQVDDVTTSAQHLSETARELKELVALFKL